MKKVQTKDLHKETAKKLSVSKKIAKTINFGLLYGDAKNKFKVWK